MRMAKSIMKPTIMHYMVTKDHVAMHTIFLKLKQLSSTTILSNIIFLIKGNFTDADMHIPHPPL